MKKDTDKAKARLVALGFQNDDLGKVRTEALTALKTARSMYLQKLARERWVMLKARCKRSIPAGQGIGTISFDPPSPKNGRHKETGMHARRVIYH